MTIAPDAPEIRKGLAGVVVDTTAISKVVPETNSLTYRGYPVQDLAANCSFEQVAYLLWHGDLPTDADGVRVIQRPISVQDLFASFCHVPGFNPNEEYYTPDNRPVKLVEGGAVVRELFS